MRSKGSTLIIGGGIAGITAAKTLLDAGFDDVKILEATEALGGRILTVDLNNDQNSLQNGFKADLGATYIHGVESNPIYQLAEQNNLLQLTQKQLKYGAVLAVTEDGEELNSKMVQEVDWHYGMLMQECEEFFALHKPVPIENESVGQFMRSEISSYLDRYVGHERKLREALFNQRLLHEACLCGSDEAMNDVSLQELGSYEELPGSNYLIHEGFSSVINALACTIPEDTIFFNHHVTKIHWDPDGRHIEVDCLNGQVFTADHVIVTVSLGYLKSEHLSLFEPQLPLEKQDAISHLGYGAVDKVILEFEDAILDGKYRRIDFLWNNDDGDEFNLKEHWYKKLNSFEFITPHTIQGWLTGESAIHLEKISDSEIIDKVCHVLERFLKITPPKTKRFIRSSWAAHKYAQGSYMYIPVGASTADVANLTEPLPYNSDYPTLLFAGEATHQVFYSTTHGAMLTGEREARRIIGMYIQNDNHEEVSDSDECDGIVF